MIVCLAGSQYASCVIFEATRTASRGMDSGDGSGRQHATRAGRRLPAARRIAHCVAMIALRYLGSCAAQARRAANAGLCQDWCVTCRSATKPAMQGRRGMIPKFTRLIGGFVALTAAACAADSSVVEELMVVPSYFDTLECSELAGQIQGASQRVKELTALREKAGNEAGGAVASALAYNTEYAKMQAVKKYAEAAANRKGCDLTKKPAAAPPPHPDGSTGPHRRGERPAPNGISQ
jgi:hypothetical protein